MMFTKICETCRYSVGTEKQMADLLACEVGDVTPPQIVARNSTCQQWAIKHRPSTEVLP
jgi:hypothetical protein